jgi:hypothetical protein
MLQFIAAGLKAASAFKSSKQAKQKLAFDANVADRDAGVALDQAGAAQLRQARVARNTMGAMRAAYGAAGVTVEGSPLDVLEASASQAELDQQTIMYNAKLKVAGLTDTANLAKYASKGQSPLLSAAGAFMSSFGMPGGGSSGGSAPPYSDPGYGSGGI